MQTIVNLGTGGADLNGQNGSTTSADSNDALFLDWPGDNAGNYLYFAGTTANQAYVLDEAALDITGDIDIRVYVALDDWTTTTGLVSKYASGQYSWALLVTSAGNPQFRWSADGSASLSKTATAAVPFSDGEAGWIRVTLDVDNGASGNDVKFYTSTDGSSWTQLGSTVTTAGVTSIYAGTANVLWSAFAGVSFAGKLYRTQILDGIDGTTVLDVDTSVISSGSATSFTALTGQTVTIGRSTSGRKSVAVVSPVWLFGTDDFMQVADNALLNPGTGSFTVGVVMRQWNNSISGGRYVQKETTLGYRLSGNTTPQFAGRIDDDAQADADGQNITYGELVTGAYVINRDTNRAFIWSNNDFGAGDDISAYGSLSNTSQFVIGAATVAASGQQDFEMLSVFYFPRALSTSELAQVQAYYESRLS